MTQPAVRGRWSLAAEWYAAGLFVVYASLLFAHAGAPALTDYANWTYQGVLLAQHLRGLPDPAHALKPYPVPNSTTTLGIGLLALVLPWMMAAKLWLTLEFAFFFAALRHLQRTVCGGAVVWIIAPQAVFLGVNFWYGFSNFELGLGLVLLFASLLLRGVRAGSPSRPRLSLVLVGAFFTHMIPFCFCVLLLLLWVRQTRRWRELWAAVPGICLTLWYVLGRYLVGANADGQAGMRASVRDYTGLFWAFKVDSYLKSFGFANPDGLVGEVYGRWGLYALLLATGVLAALSGWRLAQSGRLAWRARADERFLWLGLALLLPVYLVAPGTMLGISDPGARLLQVALALGLVLGWRGASLVAARVAIAASLILTLGGLGMFAMYGSDGGQTLKLDPPRSGRATRFALVPNDDQIFFYGALERGDLGLPVFPTGLFANVPARDRR